MFRRPRDIWAKFCRIICAQCVAKYFHPITVMKARDRLHQMWCRMIPKIRRYVANLKSAVNRLCEGVRRLVQQRNLLHKKLRMKFWCMLSCQGDVIILQLIPDLFCAHIRMLRSNEFPLIMLEWIQHWVVRMDRWKFIFVNLILDNSNLDEENKCN